MMWSIAVVASATMAQAPPAGEAPPAAAPGTSAPSPKLYELAPGDDWATVCAKALPGDVIALLPGRHRAATLDRLRGTAEHPITIRGIDPLTPATIDGARAGLHLLAPRHVVLEDLVVVDSPQNGINIDDQDGSGAVGAPWDAGVTLRRVSVLRTGPRGNTDGIKLSGLRGVRLIDCFVEGWGGSAVDMVGCHEVRIEGCTFRGLEGFAQSSGVQAKGGSTDIRISNCRFEEAGMRAVNLGGSTGLAYFRPPVPEAAPDGSRYEAERVVVERCLFVGGETAVAMVGARGGEVRECTIRSPRRWPFRLLQETTDARFGPSQGALVSGCIIVLTGDAPLVNIGPDTDPGSFRFGPNLWWGAPEAALRSLPGTVLEPQRRADPDLDEAHRPRAPAAAGFGAVR